MQSIVKIIRRSNSVITEQEAIPRRDRRGGVKYKHLKRKILSIFLFILLLFVFHQASYAQTSNNISSDNSGSADMGVAHSVQTNVKDVKDGSVLSAGSNGDILSETPYDSQVVGVVSRDAGITFNTDNSYNSVPVISSGIVYILVSSKNGNIKKGDLLTTSTIPGVAVRADNSGYVLGTALEDYVNPNPQKIDEIAIDLSLQYFNSKPTFAGTLSDIFKIALLPTKDSPTPIFKYIVAALVVLGSLVLGFISFGRTAAKGVEALGRNPAASKIIHLGIILNVGIVGVIAFAGLIVAFLILRL